ncbi:MAG TPA: phage tail protein [Candidatus Binatia bacterium]|nr:phage tail protein [Candidatus Binatia bacterium]
MSSGFEKKKNREDPYGNFKFRVKDSNGKTILGVSKIGALRRTTEVVKFREGGRSLADTKSPGRTSCDAMILERGITYDPNFENWANMVHSYGEKASMDLRNYKRDLALEVMNEKGQVMKRYFLYRCWVSEYSALPQLDTNQNAILVERIKLELKGWEREADTHDPNDNKIVGNHKTKGERVFGEVAQRVVPKSEKGKLVLPPKQMQRFERMINEINSLTAIRHKLVPKRAQERLGIFVLFSGLSGTGKIMAAEMMAGRLMLPVYRVDISQLVNKYVGETEKNLRKLFDAAEAYDIILFFDEGNAVFGNKAEVRDRHDLCANQQMSYLLERVRHFNGVAIIPADHEKTLDDAVARRIQYVMDFPSPLGRKERNSPLA